jgi:hypothetical protein
LNRKASPSPSSVNSLKQAFSYTRFLSEIFMLSPLHFGVASFSVGGFFSLLRFGVASFFIRGLSFEPLAFWGCLFFIGGLSFEPLSFWGCLFFHRRSFFLSQRTKVAIMHLCSWLWLTRRNNFCRILMRTSLDHVVYGSIPRPTSLLWSTVRS